MKNKRSIEADGATDSETSSGVWQALKLEDREKPRTSSNSVARFLSSMDKNKYAMMVAFTNCGLLHRIYQPLGHRRTYKFPPATQVRFPDVDGCG